MTQKLLWIFAYDVAADRRRLRVMKLLGNYGVRVNLSVFECVLTAEEADALAAKAARLLRRGEDHLRVYPLCASCQRRRSIHGVTADASGRILNVE